MYPVIDGGPGITALTSTTTGHGNLFLGSLKEKKQFHLLFQEATRAGPAAAVIVNNREHHQMGRKNSRSSRRRRRRDKRTLIKVDKNNEMKIFLFIL